MTAAAVRGNKRPCVCKLAFIGFSYTAGLLCASFVCGLTGLFIAAAILVIAAAYTLFAKRGYWSVVCVAVSLALGMTSYSIWQENVYNKAKALDGKEIFLSGRVTDVKEYAGDRSFCIINGTTSDGDRLTLSFFGTLPDISAGCRVTAHGTVSILEDDFSFPEESYYRSKGVMLTFDYDTVFAFSENALPFSSLIDRYRRYLGNKIRFYLGSDSAGLMCAMLFGDKSSISDAARASLYRSGIGHVTAVSGVHIAILSSLAAALCEGMGMGRKSRSVIIALLITAFVILAGASASVLRAALMSAVVLLSDVFRRRANSANSLGLAALILTIPAPYSIRDPSFLMSFCGVMGTAVIAPWFTCKISFPHVKKYKLRRLLTALSASLVTALCASAAVFPASLLFFDEVSLASPLTNVFLVPLCGAALCCGIVFAIFGGLPVTYPFLLIGGMLCKAVLGVCSFISQSRVSYLPLGYIYPSMLILAAMLSIAVCALLTHKRKPCGIIAAGFMAASLLCGAAKDSMSQDEIYVAFIGDKVTSAMVIISGGEADIVSLRGGSNAAPDVSKLLKQRGVYRINAVILQDNPESSYSRFAYELSCEDIERFYAPFTAILPDGCAERYGEMLTVQRGRYIVSIPDERTVILSTDVFSMCVLDDADAVPPENCGYIVYEKGECPPSDTECISIGADGGYTYIKIQDNGKYTTGRLNYGIGQ